MDHIKLSEFANESGLQGLWQLCALLLSNRFKGETWIWLSQQSATLCTCRDNVIALSTAHIILSGVQMVLVNVLACHGLP